MSKVNDALTMSIITSLKATLKIRFNFNERSRQFEMHCMRPRK
jgi:hypothetical protein